MKLIARSIIVLCGLLVFSSVVFASDVVETNLNKIANNVIDIERDPYQYFFNETWNDFNEELANAKEQNKKAILVFFELDECPFCHFMKHNVLNQPEVQAYFRSHFLSFAVDIEGDIELTDFAGKITTQKEFSTKANRVRATPVFAVFDLRGKRIARLTGRTSGVEEFMWLGKYIVEDAYQRMSFMKYKRMMKKKSRAS